MYRFPFFPRRWRVRRRKPSSGFPTSRQPRRSPLVIVIPSGGSYRRRPPRNGGGYY